MRGTAKWSGRVGSAFVLVGAPAFAFDFKGEKKILLHTRDGKGIAISTVHFTPQGDGSAVDSP